MRRISVTKVTKTRENVCLRSLFHSSTTLYGDQQLYGAFVRPPNREEEHKKVKELLKTRGYPDSRIKEEFETLVSTNRIPTQSLEERSLIKSRVLNSLKTYFPEDDLDVLDISMSQYGVLLRQAPFELAIVDKKNPRGLSAGTRRPPSDIYSLHAVRQAIQRNWPTAKTLSPALMNPSQLITTNDFTLILPSPLHKPRIDLLKAYTQDYPILRRLLQLNYILLYCQNSIGFRSIASSYHILGFFLENFNVPSYLPDTGLTTTRQYSRVIPPRPKGAKWKKNKNYKNGNVYTDPTTVTPFPNETSVRVHGCWDNRTIIESVVDTQIIPQPIVPTHTPNDWTELGPEEIRFWHRFFRWSCQLRDRSFTVSPCRGASARYASDFKRAPALSEADIVRKGRLAPQPTPVELRTWDWAWAPMVVQDPFWPANNLATGITRPMRGRMQHLHHQFQAGVANGHRFLSILNYILNPSIEPPSYPGFFWTPMGSMEGQDRSPLFSRPLSSVSEGSRPGGVPPVGTELDTGDDEHERQRVKTPRDLVGNLF